MANQQNSRSYQADTGAATPAGLSGQTRVVVASYPSYADAERAVDHLSDEGFPVEHVTIVGRGLHSLETVTGRLTYLRAAGRSALTGAVIGALFGWLFGLFNLINPLVTGLLLALYGLIFGAVVGAILGLVGHSLTGGRRDFSSVSTIQAETYDVMVDAPFAAAATDLLVAFRATPNPA
jgi:hypothetical protein